MSNSVSDFSSIPVELTSRSNSANSLAFYLENEYLFSLQLCQIESLSQETFEDLILLYEGSSKQLIIAMVNSRDTENNITLYKFFYSAFSLNKMLFRKDRGEITGRFSSDSRFQVKNPVTMLPIIGEVEYFIVKGQDARYTAHFIGTDYTFVHNEGLRNVFYANSLNADDFDFPEAPGIATDFTRVLDFDPQTLDIFARILDNQREALLAQIRVPFKKGFFYGIFCILNLFICLANLFISAIKFVNAHQGNLYEYTPAELVFALLIPISSNLQDYFTVSIYRSKENKSIFFSKVFAWTIYILLVIGTVLDGEIETYFVCSALQLGFTFFYSLFSVSLYCALSSHRKLN